MTTAPATTTDLTADEAEALTARIVGKIDEAYALVGLAFTGRAHVALGYGAGLAGWTAYCAARFPALRARKFADDAERAEVVAPLARLGMSARAVSAATGMAVGKAHAVMPADRPDNVVSLDGRRRSSKGTPRPAVTEVELVAEIVAAAATLTRADEALQLVREAGARGLTSNDLAGLVDWPIGSASAALSKLERRGLVRRVPGLDALRDGRAPYVIA